MDLQLSGRTALVTGSNRGTGAVIASTLQREGATVVFHANTVEEAAALEQPHVVWGDLTTDEGATQVFQQAADSIGELQILVNNYGTATAGKWLDDNTADWLDMYQKNVLSAARLIRLFVPMMRAGQWGRIVNLGTIGSHQPNNIMPHYYAAKGALATMGVSLAKELTNTGITVNTVSPGLIRTPELEAGYRRRAQKRGWGEDWTEIEKRIVAEDFPNPCGRIAEREEVADVVAFLCSERAGFITGQNIRIDGGAVCYV